MYFDGELQLGRPRLPNPSSPCWGLSTHVWSPRAPFDKLRARSRLRWL